MMQDAHPAGHADFSAIRSSGQVAIGYSPSHRALALLRTKAPFNPDSPDSQMPVVGSYPTHAPFRLARGEAQARQSDVLGPVQDVHAGEQLK